MKSTSIFSLLFVVVFTSLLACGESEQERMAREQARLDSLRLVEQQKIAAQIKAYEDSVAAAEAAMEMAEDAEEEPASVGEYNMVEDGSYVVQVGAWRSEDKAQGFVNSWADRSYPSSYVVKIGDEATGDVWFRVRVGYFSTRDDAENFGKELGQEINSGYWVSQKS